MTIDEAQELLHAQLGLDRHQTTKMVRMCDKNNDGSLSYDEFVDFYFKVKERWVDERENGVCVYVYINYVCVYVYIYI